MAKKKYPNQKKNNRQVFPKEKLLDARRDLHKVMKRRNG